MIVIIIQSTSILGALSLRAAPVQASIGMLPGNIEFGEAEQSRVKKSKIIILHAARM